MTWKKFSELMDVGCIFLYGGLVIFNSRQTDAYNVALSPVLAFMFAMMVFMWLHQRSALKLMRASDRWIAGAQAAIEVAGQVEAHYKELIREHEEGESWKKGGEVS